MKLALQILLPLIVLVAAGGTAARMIASMEKPAVTAPPPSVPLVRAIELRAASVAMEVRTQGTVEPLNSVAVSAQVAGRIKKVSDKLRAGEFFAAGEPLAWIDDADYRLALVQADAAVARAELRLAQERAEAEVSKRAWEQLEADRAPDALATRALFVAEAESALAAAKAGKERATLDLQRTIVSLPFQGRVRSASADAGQYVAPGQPLGQAYGTDFVEVRLPIPDDDAAFLDLARGPEGEASAHAVTLAAEFAGRRHEWMGSLVRTEGEIDRKTRQVTLVARVAAPFDTRGEADRQPLTVGMFVEATIRGRSFENVIAAPRAAIRPDGTLLTLDAENRLRAMPARVLRKDRDTAYLQGIAGQTLRVVVSHQDAFVDGMPVQVLEPVASPVVTPVVAPRAGSK